MSKDTVVIPGLHKFQKLPNTEQKQKIQLAFLMDKITEEEFSQLVKEYTEQVEVEDESEL